MRTTLIAVFGIIEAILILMHAAVYQSLAAAFGWAQPGLAWLFVVLSITFVSSSILAHRYCNGFITWYYRISAYWFGVIQALFLAAVIFYFSAYVLYAANQYVPLSLIGGLSFGICILIHAYATWQTNQLKVTRVTIPISRDNATLPEFWRGKKVIFVSDVHLGIVRGANFAKKVVAKIAAESPEVVLVAGDLFDGVKCHPRSLIEPFRVLRPSQGIYFVSGNHEYIITETETLFKEIKDVGLTVLRNESVDLHGVQFAGVDWKDTNQKGNFETLLAGMGISHAKPSILMRHEPNHLDVAERAGISLTLSGHTHQGQIFPLRYITRSMYKGFDYGLKKLRSMMVFTSSGVGTWGPPLRVGTKPEIVAITLQ